MIFQAFRQHILRTGQKNVFSIQFKEIRTFPHFSKTFLIFCKDTDKFPVKSILTSVKKNLSTSVCRSASDNTIEFPVFSFPDFWITEIYFTCTLRKIFGCQNRILLIFLIIFSISNSHCLCLNIPYSSIFHFFLIYRSIDEQLSAVLQLYCAS